MGMSNSSTMHKICVIGLGYIGLPTAAVISSRGYTVHGVETNPNALEIINSGRAHVIEPDLDALVKVGVESGRLRAYPQPATADVFMICVPTPVGEENGADLSFVRSATESICPFLRPGNLVILESTCPPGTTELIARIVKERTGLTEDQVHFAHAPERVLPGHILREVIENDRIVGGINEASTQAACAFYTTYVTGKLITCHCRMAEMAKLTENASRDVQIAFANELSMICDDLGLDVRELIRIANHHPRVNILQPGCGVGGHCIAVDPWFIVHMAKGVDGHSKARLMETAREVNNAKPHWVVDKVGAAVQAARRGGMADPAITCFGAAYKPDIDDLRESPALEICDALERLYPGCIAVVEPNLQELPGHRLVDLEEGLGGDVLAFLVGHKSFTTINPERLAGKQVVDAAGVVHASQS